MKPQKSSIVAVDGVVTHVAAFATIPGNPLAIFECTKEQARADFVYTKKNELAVVSSYGLYLYDYKREETTFYRNLGQLFTIDVLDDHRVVFNGIVEDRHSIVIFDHIAKEVVDIHHTERPFTKIKIIAPDLLVCIGDFEEIYFLDCQTWETVHTQLTTDHEGNIKHGWVSSVEIVDDDVIVYGGSDCKLSFFNHKKMQLEYEVSRPGWIRDIVVFENKLVATDGGSNKFAVWDYVNKTYLFNERTPRDGWVKEMCYAGDGTILFSPNRDWVFGLKMTALYPIYGASTRRAIKKQLQAHTDVTKNRVCFKEQWIKTHSKPIPFPFGIRKVIIGNKNRIFFLNYLKIFSLDMETKRISDTRKLSFDKMQALQVNERFFALVSGYPGMNSFMIYDLDLKRVVYTDIIKDLGNICKLNDTTLVVPKKEKITLFDLETFTYSLPGCGVSNDTPPVKKAEAIDEHRIAVGKAHSIQICNIKTQESHYVARSKKSREFTDFVVLDHAHLAYTIAGNELAVVNYQNNEVVAHFTIQNTCEYLNKIDDKTVVIVDASSRILFFNYKKQEIVRKVEHYGPSPVQSVIPLPDRRIAVVTYHAMDIYDSLEKWQCEISIKPYEDGTVKIEDYLHEEATLTHPFKRFQKPPKTDPRLEQHIAFYEPKRGNVLPFSTNPKAVQFVKDNPFKVIVRDWGKSMRRRQ